MSAAVTAGRYAVTFVPADPPRAGTLLLWSPDGDDPPDGPGEVAVQTLATPPGGVPAPVPVRRAALAAGLPLLLTGRSDEPAAAFWAAAARQALHLAARGLLLPDITPAGHDTWRVGPLGDADTARLRALAAAMPAAARARPVPGRTPTRLPDPGRLLRDFLDAVADTLPRDATAAGAWAATTATAVPALRRWAARVSADADAAVRLSLRLEPVGAPDGPWRAAVQLHRRTDPGLLTDAAALWAGPVPGFPATSRDAALLALRDAARHWPPLAALLDRPVPDALLLTDDDLTDLLAGAARRLAEAGVPVHWPAGVSRDLTAAVRLRVPHAGGRTAGLGDLVSWRWIGGWPCTANR